MPSGPVREVSGARFAVSGLPCCSGSHLGCTAIPPAPALGFPSSSRVVVRCGVSNPSSTRFAVPRDDEIFAQVFELPAEERAAFLDGACATDAAQRARIEALLAADEAGGSFLDRSPGQAALLAAEEKPGDVIGRYTLLEKIGEGGCGTVYLAEQKVPVQRKVALKVIKLGMDTRAVITRFEAERQALALMDHPDIARVFDAGATEAGRPFFVMELVTGEPITRFCDEHALSVPARLELFSRVCGALQHAHQKGIIHRDVKPSNILVTIRDGEPSPKVIDFGIAKATQERLTDETLVTAVDQFIGTPAYMSPEQADRRTADIDTRSDIYSLGVLLYELLTGRLPFDPQLLARAGVDELRRITREVEPLRPSVRLRTLGFEAKRTERVGSTLAGGVEKETSDQSEQAESWAGRPCHPEQTLAAIATARASSPLQLASALKGDLDWIVMRCLEKDRERRYGSARELADDVQRYLNREPVRARPPSTGYRVERFVARNRLACASAAAIGLALIVGTVVSVGQAVRATRAEHVANAERDAAKVAGQAEALARADAQRRQEQAEDLLTFMLGDFRTELQKIGRLQLLDAVGEKAMAYFAALDARDLTDTALARQAKALTQIGEVRMDQARYADAHAAFTAAYDRAAALARRHPRNGDMLFDRAQAEYWIGFVSRCLGNSSTQREWLTRYRDSAIELQKLEGNSRRALDELTYSHHNLAVLELDAVDLAAARDGFHAERAVLYRMLRDGADVIQVKARIADAYSWLGEVEERDGNYSAAIDCFTQMRDLYASLSEAEPLVATWRFRLGQSDSFLAFSLGLVGREADAEEALQRAAVLLRAFVDLDPENRQWRGAFLRNELGRCSHGLSKARPRVSLPIIQSLRLEIESLCRDESGFATFGRLLPSAYCQEAESLLLAGQIEDCYEILEPVFASERSRTPEPEDLRSRTDIARAHLLAGRAADLRGRHEDAQDHWRRVLSLVEPWIRASNDWRVLDPASEALLLLGRFDEAQSVKQRLHRLGYSSRDPFAAPVLAAASSPSSKSN